MEEANESIMKIIKMIKENDISQIKPELEKIVCFLETNCACLESKYKILEEGKEVYGVQTDFKKQIIQELKIQKMLLDCYTKMYNQTTKEGLAKVLGSYIELMKIIEQDENPQLNYEVINN